MFKYIKDSNLSKKIFWFGIFLLPSAPSISFILLFLSLILSIKDNLNKLNKDKWNLIFIFSAFILPIICFFQSDQTIPLTNNWEKSLTWIGLTNWTLLIFCFLAFQFFVNNSLDRKIFSKLLIAGSLPVLFSGFLQYFFRVYGPFEILDGFIIWFQRPLQADSGMTALFNNQNYAGAWFCLIWPLCLAALIESFSKKLEKYICLSILLSITAALILTTSRSAWGGLILLVPLMTGVSSLLYFLPVIVVIFILILLSISSTIPFEIQNFAREIIPNRFLQEFIPQNFEGRESRPEIWESAIIFITQKPFLGWGAAAFPVLYYYEKSAYAGHSHNLILELALSYGIPTTILIFGSIFLITFYSFKKIFINISFYKIDFFERAWFSSFFVLLISQLVDIQYFDGRISIVFWILLAGLKEIIESKVNLKRN